MRGDEFAGTLLGLIYRPSRRTYMSRINWRRRSAAAALVFAGLAAGIPVAAAGPPPVQAEPNPIDPTVLLSI
jgi:hypothetical protein